MSPTKGTSSIRPTLLGVSLLLSLPGLASYQLSAQRTGAEWLELIDAAEEIPHSYSLVLQEITTSGGSRRSFTIRSWSAENGDVSLMVYVDPARVAGDKILQLEGGDSFWYYMKRRDVTRHFAGHNRKQSAMGSDFSYEDLATGELTEDYTAEVLGHENLDGIEVVKLRLMPTESGPSYDHLILWAAVDDHLTRKIEYYDEEHHLKTLFLTGFQVIEGRKLAMKLEMVNHREGSSTTMEFAEITFSEEPDPALFTKAALSRQLPDG